MYSRFNDDSIVSNKKAVSILSVARGLRVDMATLFRGWGLMNQV